MKNSFLGQTEILSIIGAVFVLNGLPTAGWTLLSLGIVGAFLKFTMIFHAEGQREQKKILTESEKQIHEFTKRLVEASAERSSKENLL